MKVFLAPTDFSEASFFAIRYALYQFCEEAVELHLLHVYTPLPISGRFLVQNDSSDYLAPLVEEIAKEQLQVFETRLASNFDLRLKICSHSSFSLLNHAIDDLVAAFDVDLIIAATEKDGGLATFIQGSSTNAMIRGLKSAPLLIVPSQTNLTPLTKIAVAIEPNTDLDSHSKEIIDTWVKSMNLELLFVEVIEDQVPIPVEAPSYASSLEDRKRIKISKAGRAVSDVLTEFCWQQQISLIVLQHKRRGVLYRLLHEPTINNLVFNHRVPMLILPDSDIS